MKLIHLIYIIVVFIPNFVSGSDIDNLKSSLTFVIDDTASMHEEIEAVKAGAKAIFDQVVSHNESQVENYKLVTFNDMDYLDVIDKGIKVRAETKDHDVFKQAISNIDIGGGGLCPEYALSGIKKALEISLPRSDLYVFTDASAKDYEDFEEIKSLAQKKQSRIVFVLTGVCSSTNDDNYKVYQKIASATDGEVFNIMKQEVSKVLEYVKKVITGRRTTLATKTLPPGKHNFTFDADTIMGGLTISLSANKADDPKVDVTAPDGSDVWKKIIFETDKAKVYSVDVTEPGTHTVKLENKAETHAKVSAESVVDFRHGFSKFKPSSIGDTSTRPAPGVQSHLSIELNKGDIELKAIQILDMADNVITELPLLPINKGTKLYTTKAFDPPDTMFNVMIIGYDPKTNSTIKRKASTPVEPQKPPKEKEIENKKPTVTIEGAPIISATQGKPIQLVCKINGYPKPDVIWINKNTNKPETGEISVLELPYDYLNVLSIAEVSDNTTYECKAINSLGANETQVALNVSIENKFIVINTPKRVSVEYGKEVKVQCIVDAVPPAEITWIRRRKILQPNDNIELSSNNSTLTIKRATSYDKGTYSCDIRNKFDRKLFNKVVKVISEAPKIDDRTPRNVTVKIGSSVDLECRIVKGLPKPSISWIYSYGDTSAERVEKPEWRNKEEVTIKYANRLDTGKYTCIAENEIYGDSREIDVLVEYAPSVEVRRKLIKAKTGDVVHINCIIYGGPKPKVVWSKDGVKLRSYDRMRIYRNNVLRFKARSSDSGVYKCTAINSIGTAFEEIRVEISSPPVIAPPTKSQYVILKDGGAILPCQANGDPEPRIQWLFYSDKTKSFPKISFQLLGMILKLIQQLKEKHLLQLNHKNLQKEIENKKPTVTIEGAPIISATQGKPIQLVCKINGYPKPDVIWINKNTNKPETGEISVLELPYDYLNVLSIAEVSDNTTYECKAINSLGANETQVALNVSIENKFIVINTPKRVSVEYGKEVKVQCIVDAVPPAEITWIRRRKILQPNDNIELSSNNSTLTIKRATSYDKGTYSCDIRNKFDRKLFNKVVKVISEAPKIDDRTPRNVTVKIGSSVDLECRIVKGLPKPSISWIYSYGDTSAERVEKPEWRNKEEVTIKYANRLDTGKYTCIAENEIYGDSREIDVLVEYAPSVEVRRKLIKAKTGDVVHINCIIYGGPKPKVVWSKDGVKLRSYDRMRIYRNNVLRFKARSSDSGVYKCTAINSIGTAFEEIRVEISSPPVIAPPTKSQYVILKDGGAILPCQANGDPEPRIQWLFYSDKTKSFPKISFQTKKTGELVLKKVQIQDEGYYTCIASNAAGSANVTYPVVVYEPAKIIKKHRDNHFVAVEGDTVLRLTCEVTGNPKPKISWTKDDQLIASGSSHYIEDGVLMIRDVPKAAQGKYQCYAENAIGHDYEDFFVLVNSYPPSINVTTTHVMVEKEKPARLECPLRHRNIDELRWYKNGKLIIKGELTITRVSVSDVGLYTCRVSDMYRAESANVKVDVGIPPEFRTEEESDVDMVSDVNLSCENVGVPNPSVTWYKDGRRMDWTESDYFIEMSSNSVGQYRCDVRNVFGTISRTFNLIPNHCYIDTQKLTKLQPIMIGPDAHWPKSLSRGHIIEFNKDEPLVLFCPNKFQQFASKYVYAFCAGGTNVKVNGNLYDYSDIQCSEEVKHIVKKTGEKCMAGDTEKLRITYKELADYGEEEAYEICWNKAEQSPIYARHILSPESMADSDYEALWSNGDELNMNYTEAYDCEGQINRISAVRGEGFHADDRCCFSPRQLVNPKDVFPGIPQKATFSYYNVVPQWSSCNSENWDAIEDRVRNFAKDSLSGSDLIVWTGSAKKVSLPTKYSAPKEINSFFMDQRANMQPVPMFLWKVIQDPSSRQSIAIVQINIPDLRPSDVHNHVLCSDVCNRTDWMQNPAWHDVKKGYTYCCNIEEFEHEFGYRGIFEPAMERLLENHSLPEPGGLVV